VRTPVTFVGKDGFRRATCLLCGKTMRITSWPDDTRWRYPSHDDGTQDGESCDNSLELVPLNAAVPWNRGAP
jgi:hypothetical protein